MTRSRSSKKKVKSEKIVSFLAFFVFAPIVAVLMGVAVVKYIILPQFSDTQKINEEAVQNTEVFNKDNNDVGSEKMLEGSNDEEMQKAQTISIEGFSIYNIQLGSFSTRENAENFVKELIDKKIYGYVVDLDGYKVFSGSYFIREEAEEYLEEVKKFYEDSFINTISINDKEISYYNEDIEYVKKLSELHDLVKKSYAEEVSLWKSVINSDDKDILISFLKSNTDEMELLLNYDFDEITSEKIKNYFTVIELITIQRKKLLSDIGKSSETDIAVSYKNFMKGLFEYYKMVDSL